MRMGVIGDIIDGLRLVESVKMEFSSDREAAEFCRENDIPTSEIEYDDNGNAYIEDVDNKVMKRDLNNYMRDFSKIAQNNTRKKNMYSYKGLESYSDYQIKLFMVKNAIYKDSKGMYHVNWNKVNSK